MKKYNLDKLRIGHDYTMNDVDAWLFEKEGKDGGQKWLHLLYIKIIDKWENFEPVYTDRFYQVSFNLKAIWQGKSRKEALEKRGIKANKLIKKGWEVSKTAGRA